MYVSTQEIRPECKVCELRYRPIVTIFFIQEYNLLFPIPNKNVIFNIHDKLFQNQYFFLVNSSNLMDTIKTKNCTHRITVEFHCQFTTNLLRPR